MARSQKERVMTSSILLDVHATESLTFKTALERVCNETRIERRARVLEGLAQRAVRLLESAPEVWREFLEALAERDRLPASLPGDFRHVLDTLTQSHVFVLALGLAVGEFKKAGHPLEPELDQQLAQADKEFDRLVKIVAQSEELLDESALVEAKEAAARGDYPSAGEALENVLATRRLARATIPYEQMHERAQTNPVPAEWLAEDMEGLY